MNPDQVAAATQPGSFDCMIKQFECIEAEWDRFRHAMAAKLQVQLRQMQGVSFESLSKSQEIAMTVRKYMNRLNYLVECPYCGKPASFICQPRKSGLGKNGVFLFKHWPGAGDKNTLCGGTITFPGLALIPVAQAPQTQTSERNEL